MGRITDLAAMTGAAVDPTNDLVTMVDASEAGAAKNKKMTIEELNKALAGVEMTASEALAIGDFVNVHASAGAKIRKANATDDTKPVNGFVPAAIAGAATGFMLTPGVKLSGLAGLTPGVPHYLSTAGGTITDTPPAGAGNLVQEVGIAISATELLFNPKQGVTL